MASSASPANEYIYILRATRVALLTEGPTPEEAQILNDHWNHLVGLHQKGIVLYCARTTENDERTFGLVVFKSDSLEKAGDFMRADPAIQRGVMRGEVHPFQVFLKESPNAIAAPTSIT
jgi:uncharacterized protein